MLVIQMGTDIVHSGNPIYVKWHQKGLFAILPHSIATYSLIHLTNDVLSTNYVPNTLLEAALVK